MTQTKRKLTIPRDRWLHGEGEGNSSKLFRTSDGKQCCVGFYLEACGVPRVLLEDRSSAHTPGTHNKLPEEATWLVLADGCPVGTSIAYSLYQANDYELDTPYWDSYEDTRLSLSSNEDREARIIDLFAKQGVEVTFV